jgi:spore germination protein KC
LINTGSEADKIPAKHISDTIKNTKATAQSYKISVYDFLEKINTEGQEATAGAFQFRPSSDQTNLMQMDVRGTAVFKGDKLIGWLNPEETMGLNMIENKAAGAVFDVRNPLVPGKYFVYEFLANKTSVKAVIKNGKPSIRIKAKPIGGINLVTGRFPVNSNTVKLLQEASGDHIKKMLEKTVDRAQHELKSDIFGFGHKIYQANPAYWNQIKDNWDAIYPTIPVDVEVDAKIREFGVNLIYERIRTK